VSDNAEAEAAGWIGRFLDRLSEGVAHIDAAGDLKAVNAAFRGIVPDGALDWTGSLRWSAVLDALPIAESDLRPHLDALRALATGQPPLRLRTVRDETLEFEVAAGPGAERLVVVRRALTGLLATPVERALIDTLWRAPVGLLLLDRDDRVVFWNEQMLGLNALIPAFHGQTLEQFLRGMCAVGFAWAPPDFDEGRWIADRMRRHAEYDGPFEERMGSRRWYLTSEHRNAEGATLIIHVEITAQKEAEAALIVARDQAHRANQAKSQFLANMSHELRTPLNAIMGFSEVIRDHPLGPIGHPRYAEYAGDIYDSGRHLLELVNTILDLAKIESGQFELDPEPVDMAAEIAAVMRSFEIRAHRAGLSLISEARECPIIEADRRAVRQMLLNLISNAVKFTPPGGRIVVTAEPLADMLDVTVRDNGPGIAAEDLPRALEPFGQIIARKTDDENLGTGLGLPLVRALIERHDGRLAIETAPGKGTAVSLFFPLRPAVFGPPGGVGR
jgi:signal transduction histidine kinase